METAASLGSSTLSGISTFIVLLGVFLPEIAILSGFLSDLMNVRVRHMPTSAFGVLSAVVNWVLALLIGPKPENASFFSLPARNAVSPSSSPEAAAISKLTKLFPPTFLGVASPLAMGNTVNSGRPAPTRTVREAAKQVVAAANPVAAASAAIPAPLAGPQPTLTPETPSLPSRDDRSEVGSDAGTRLLDLLNTRVNIGPQSGVQLGKSRDSAFDVNSSVAAENAQLMKGRGRQMKGGSRLADMVNDQFNPCSVRGLGTFDVAKRPMGIAVLTTIFFVYLLDMSVNKKRTTGEQISYWFVAAGVLGVNIYAYMKLGCVDGIFSLSLWVPLLVGLVVGGSAFAIYQRLGPDYLPMDAEAPSAAEGTAPTGEYSACASGNGGDFVCDAYLNGQRIGTVGSAAT